MEILKGDWQTCGQKPRDRLDNSLLVVLTAVHIFSLHLSWRVVSLESYPTVLALNWLSEFRIKHLQQFYDNNPPQSGS